MNINGKEVDTLTIKPIRIITEEEGILVVFKVCLVRNGIPIYETYFQKLTDKDGFYIEGENIKVFGSVPGQGSVTLDKLDI